MQVSLNETFIFLSNMIILNNIFKESLDSESILTSDEKNSHDSNDSTENMKYLIAVSCHLEQSHLQQWRIIFHQKDSAEESTWKNLGRE